MTFEEKIYELEKQKNTLAMLIQTSQRLDFEEMRIVSDNSFNVDRSRISAVKEFVDFQSDTVRDIIDDIINVSGI